MDFHHIHHSLYYFILLAWGKSVSQFTKGGRNNEALTEDEISDSHSEINHRINHNTIDPNFSQIDFTTHCETGHGTREQYIFQEGGYYQQGHDDANMHHNSFNNDSFNIGSNHSHTNNGQ